jgi:hypothetical protein
VVAPVAVVAASVLTANESGSSQGIGEPERAGSSVRVLRSRWIDIAAHLAGVRDSVWRTDVVVLNRSESEASVELVLHLGGGIRRVHDTVAPSSSKPFNDVVGLFGVEGKGPLEVRSDQPVTVHGRTYSVDESGTVGQFVDSYDSEDGLEEGESGWLSGLRQLQGEYRSNVCITNTGADVALVHVSLFTGYGFWLMTFPVVIEPGQGHHELQPFLIRRSRNDVACGCVRIEVVAGSGILASASVIDQRTNDAITIPMKR